MLRKRDPEYYNTTTPILNKNISGLLKITKDTSQIDRILIIDGGQTE